MDRPELEKQAKNCVRTVLIKDGHLEVGLNISGDELNNLSWELADQISALFDTEQIDTMLVEARRTAKKQERERMLANLKAHLTKVSSEGIAFYFNTEDWHLGGWDSERLQALKENDV